MAKRKPAQNAAEAPEHEVYDPQYGGPEQPLEGESQEDFDARTVRNGPVPTSRKGATVCPRDESEQVVGE